MMRRKQIIRVDFDIQSGVDLGWMRKGGFVRESTFMGQGILELPTPTFDHCFNNNSVVLIHHTQIVTLQSDPKFPRLANICR